MKNKKSRILKLIGAMCILAVMVGCGSTKKELKHTEHPSVMKESIRHVRLTKDGETSFEVMYDPQEYKNNADYWEILVPYESTVVVDTEAMYQYYELVSGIDFGDLIEVEKDMDTGIDGATDNIYVEYYAEQEEGKSGQADATASYLLKIGNEDGNGNRYAALEGFEEQVYLVSENILNNIFEVNPYNMILKVVNLVDVASVSSVDISFGDEKHTLTKSDKKYTYDGNEIEESEFSNYYTSLLSVFIQKEIPTDTKLAKDREKVGEIVYQRTTDEAKTSTTTFYAYDDEYCTVNVDGVECFMVLKSDVEQLRELF